jgi:hypothetical protein
MYSVSITSSRTEPQEAGPSTSSLHSQHIDLDESLHSTIRLKGAVREINPDELCRRERTANASEFLHQPRTAKIVSSWGIIDLDSLRLFSVMQKESFG